MGKEADQVRTANETLQKDANAALSTKGFGAAITAWVNVQDPPLPPPALTVASSIPNGATLTGPVAWTAAVIGAATKVDFLVDGAVKWTENGAPWQFNGDPDGKLDPAPLGNGTHTLALKATGADGQTGTTQVQVAVNIPATPPPPGSYDPHTAWLGRPWTSDATRAPVDPNSATLIGTWQAHGHIKYPNVTTNSFSTAWAVGKATDKAYDIPVTKYGVRKLLGVHVPAGVKPSPDSDAHLTIFDNANGRIYEMWQAAYVNNAWTCSSCADYPLNVIDPGKSGTASGIPAWGVCIWPEVIKAGRIGHALGFSVVQTVAGSGAAPGVWRYPARGTDGKGTAQDLPEGAWLAFPPGSVAKTTWPAWAKVIFAALTEYGMFLVDGGGTMGISGVNPVNGGVKWSDVGMGTGGSIGLPADFPWATMRVLSPPAKP